MAIVEAEGGNGFDFGAIVDAVDRTLNPVDETRHPRGDEEMVQSLQNGVGSRSFEPGPLSYLETSIHHLIDYNLERTFGKGGNV